MQENQLFFHQPILVSLINKLTAVYETTKFLTLLKHSATGSSHEPHIFSLHPTNYIHLNVLHLFTCTLYTNIIIQFTSCFQLTTFFCAFPIFPMCVRHSPALPFNLAFNTATTFEETTRPIQSRINLLQPTGHVMHQQFNIQQFYVLPTLYLRVLYLSENNQRLVPHTA